MMKKMIKKITAILMTLAMVISLMPAMTLTANAAEADYTYPNSTHPDAVAVDQEISFTLTDVFGETVPEAENGGFSEPKNASGQVAYIQLNLPSPSETNHITYNSDNYPWDGDEPIYFKAAAAGTYEFDVKNSSSTKHVHITVTGGNTAPALSATGGTPTFTENGSAVDLFSGVAAETKDTDQTFSGMTLTVSNVTDTKEYLSIGGTDVELTNGKSGTITGIGSYSITVSSNTATVTVSGMSLSDTQMGSLIDGITYGNASDDPTAIANSRAIKITGITDSGSSSNSASPNITATVSITAANDAPTLTTTGANPTFTEGGSAADIFSAVTVSTIETSQALSELKLTVSNLADGSSEILNADGTDIALTNGTTGTTATNSMGYNVSESASTATVTLSKAAGISAANMQTLIDGISYKNNSHTPTTGSRVITITSLKDNGTTENGGVDTITPSVASTVTVAAVNDAPFTRNIASFLKLGTGTVAKSAAGTYATSQTDNITLESWIYLENTTGAHPVLFNGNGGNSGYGIYLDGSTVNVLLGGVGWIYCSSGTSYNAANRAVLTAGHWTHIAVTRNTGDGGTYGWKTYINGQSMVTQFIPNPGVVSGSPNPLNSGSNVQIGPSGSDLAGLSVSEARIWNRALTQAEIQSNMRGTVATNASGLVGYWKLTDGSGATVADIQTNQPDHPALNLPITGPITWIASTVGSTAEDTAISGRLAGGDVETSVTYAKASDPTHGTVAVNVNGSYTYTPSADFNGSDSFTFVTNDGFTNSTDRTVNLTVTPVNDAPTSIALSNASIAEGTAADTAIGTLSTIDPDTGDTFAYTIQSVKDKNGNGISTDTFAINGNQLLTKAALSFSANNSYTVTIRTSDGTATYDKTFTITVTETNVAPTDISLTAASIAENSAIGTAIGTLSTTDANTPAPFTYTIVSGDTSSFQISGNELQLNMVPDFETKNSYSITIRTKDNGNLTYDKTFTITVTNVNEAPIVTASGGTSAFSEAATGISTPVVVDSGLTVADADSGTIMTSVTAKISANYNSTQDELSFTNDGSTMGNIAASFDTNTGVLTLSSASGTATVAQWQAALRAVKYTNTSHNPTTLTRTITFSVSDGALSATATKNVSVTQSNSAPTGIVLSTSSVAENSSIGTTVGTLTATDSDVDDAYTCSLVAGYGDNASFTIESVTATDYALKLAVSPNYEVKNSYSIRVRATDIAGATYDEDFSVTISDANDAPSITSDATASFAENGTGTVYTATGTDPDASDTLTWSISGTDAGLFNINGSTGVLTFKAAPNYEAPADSGADNVYNLTVTATDNGTGTLTATKTIAITVTNVNEAPSITTAVTLSVTEGSTAAFTAAATDPEGSSITWSITGGTDAGKFSIVPGTGVVTFTTAPAYSTPTDADAHNDYVLEITASDGILSAVKTVTVTVTQKVSGGGGSGGGGSNTGSSSTSTVVEVNGEKQDAGTTNTQTAGGQTVTTIKVDDTKLNKVLESKGEKPTITLPTGSNSDVTVGELNGQTVKNLEQKEAILEIKTPTITYTLPASQIKIDDVSAQIGTKVDLKDIKVSVKIAEPSADTVKIVENTADKNNYQIVVKPIEFEITCTSGNKTVDVSKFNGYVERTVAIPDGVDPKKITTGIVLNSDGTFSHVPTQIVVINGKYYAKINSLTNSTYSVIWNPVTFTDVANHWSKDTVNDMGSRMVVTGTGNGTYEPDRSITRAEFAAIAVRAMGLQKGTTESNFGDVTLTDWFNGYVDTATAYSLITGYNSKTYGPDDMITREQAMAILARAMKLTGLNTSLTDSEKSTILSRYTDGASVSDYAKTSAAICIKTGVVTGSSTTTLSPKEYVTRAEVAAMIQRLLQKSGLI